jgi:predicted phosphodiesterase
MVRARVDDDLFIKIWNEYKSPSKVAKVIDLDITNVYLRRRNIEKKYNIKLDSSQIRDLKKFHAEQEKEKLAHRIAETRGNVRRGTQIENGRVIVFSDAHFYPDTETTAYLGLLEAIKEFKPEVIVANGDIFDGTSISRHPRIMFADVPTVLEELDAVTHYMGQIEKASKFKSNLIHTFGNHDARFESYLSANVPQYQNIKGFQLKDHLPTWQACWSFWCNSDTIIKHRLKGGTYAGYNNVKAALGANIITGHTHVLAVQPLTGYQKTFYGVQTGCLANPKGDQFIGYLEDAPSDWRSGFAMLTFKNGRLLMPELFQVHDENDGTMEFRGKVYQV